MHRFIFALLDHASLGDEALDRFELKVLLGQDSHQGLATSSTSVSQFTTVSGGAASPSAGGNKSSSKSKRVDDEQVLYKKKDKSNTNTSNKKGFGAK